MGAPDNTSELVPGAGPTLANLADAAKKKAEQAAAVQKAQYDQIVNDVQETVEVIGKAAEAFKNLGGLLSAGKGAGQSSDGARKHDHQGGFRFSVELGGIKA